MTKFFVHQFNLPDEDDKFIEVDEESIYDYYKKNNNLHKYNEIFCFIVFVFEDDDEQSYTKHEFNECETNSVMFQQSLKLMIDKCKNFKLDNANNHSLKYKNIVFAIKPKL